jgi:hypothetical protein
VPNPDVEILALEAVPELSEVVECDPPMEDPEVELETALPLRDRLEPVVAMGVETLLACVESGNGNASVTAALDPFAGGVKGTSNGNCDAGGGLNFAVAGEMRTEKKGIKNQLSYDSTRKLTWARKTIKAMHLNECALLITLVSETTKETISTKTRHHRRLKTNRTNP